MSLLVMRSSLGYNMLLHSRQKRKVICSWAFVGWASADMLEGAGEAMVSGGCGEGRGILW